MRVLEYCNSEFSSEKVEYGYQSINLIEAYYRLNQVNEANQMVEELYQSSADYFNNNIESLDINKYETRLTAPKAKNAPF